MKRRNFVALATTGLATTALAGTAFAQAIYPVSPISIVIPAPPGGGTVTHASDREPRHSPC
jgi:tripartite-type tricarboxylate transporter receptor subunit TctC